MHKPTVQTVVQTVNGECKVKIELEININLNEATSDKIQVKVAEKDEKDEKDEVWAIPDFDSTELFEFGKKE